VDGIKAYLGRVLGADGRTILAGVASGHAAYAYHRDAADHWNYDGALVGPDGSAWFYSGGVSGDIAVLGGSTVDGVGFVYVFRRRGAGDWPFVRKIYEPEQNGEGSSGYFGYHMAVQDDLVVVSNFSAGAAYVFRKKGISGLFFEETLRAPDGDSDGGAFGWSVATDGEQILVGALGNGGTAYVYENARHGHHWLMRQKLKSPPVTAPDGVQQYFGNAVAISGRTIVVASPNADYVEHPRFKAGAAFVFARRDHRWELQQKLVEPQGIDGVFGQAVAAEGSRILVSAWGGTDPNGAAASERIYAYDRKIDAMQWQPRFLMSRGSLTDAFGYFIAWSGPMIVTSELDKPLPSPVFYGQVDVYLWPERGRSEERDEGRSR
jgi:hypothetical protein